MSCSDSCHVFDDGKAADSLVGSIVVNTNEVSFHVFKANSIDIVKVYKTPVKNETSLRDGWAEQDPMLILAAVQDCIINTVTAGEVMGLPIVTVGITNHRCTIVAWNKQTGIPLCNAILWSDSRSANMVNNYMRKYDKYRFQKICGLPFSHHFSAFKIKWLIENDEKVISAYRDDNCYFGTIDSWLVWNLTGGVKGGVFATDSSNASNTFLMNINTLEWDTTLLKFFGISLNCLPKIKTSSEMYGHFADGPLVNTTISGVIANEQAALIGHRCFRRGLTKVILDEGGSVFNVTGDRKVFSNNGLLTTIAYQLDTRPVYALEGPIASAGKSIEWAKNCFNVREAQCYNSEIKGNIQNYAYFIPAFNGLYAPYWRPEARSILVGVDEFITKDDILKAAMESVSFQIQDIIEALVKDLKTSIDKIRVDGGLSNNKFIMQSLANITNTQVEVARFKEMTALGAAMAAGYAPEINVWKALCMPEDIGVNYHSKITDNERKIRIFDWKRALFRSFNWFDFKTTFNNFWLMVPIVSGFVLLGGYLILKLKS